MMQFNVLQKHMWKKGFIKNFLSDSIRKQVIAKLAVLVRNLEQKQGRIRAEHEFWNEK